MFFTGGVGFNGGGFDESTRWERRGGFVIDETEHERLCSTLRSKGNVPICCLNQPHLLRVLQEGSNGLSNGKQSDMKICLEICFESSTTTYGRSFCKKCLRSAADKCLKEMS
ncbi:unnamed protein product [Arabis nemorensis]|uniref:Uncharacterized protein n=1 Tax=Arabis nemorensis TaxID=586526 RepID=A0A565CGA6_9BRAS|nr:unnamed protein product [Arabis nemorensis]